MRAAAWVVSGQSRLLLFFAAVFATGFAFVLAALGTGLAFVGAALFAGIACEGTGGDGRDGEEGQNGFHKFGSVDLFFEHRSPVKKEPAAQPQARAETLVAALKQR